MGTKTTRLDLLKPGENDYYNQQTEQADNWQKVDDYAVYTDRDKNAIWGGLDGGGLIEDPSVTKVVGKRYIGADGKAYICLVPSNINNSTNYAPCNVVDNFDKLQNLVKTIKTQVAEIYLSDIGATLILNKYENNRWTEYEFSIILTNLTIGTNQLVKTDTKISGYIGISLDDFFFSVKVAGVGTTATTASNSNTLMFKFLDSSKPAGIPASIYGYSKKFFK